jgi:hypothetical protein
MLLWSVCIHLHECTLWPLVRQWYRQTMFILYKYAVVLKVRKWSRMIKIFLHFPFLQDVTAAESANSHHIWSSAIVPAVPVRCTWSYFMVRFLCTSLYCIVTCHVPCLISCKNLRQELQPFHIYITRFTRKALWSRNLSERRCHGEQSSLIHGRNVMVVCGGNTITQQAVGRIIRLLSFDTIKQKIKRDIQTHKQKSNLISLLLFYFI